MNPFRLHHIGVWVGNLEAMREFYVTVLGGSSGPKYVNPQTDFQSYFISFLEDFSVELMSRPCASRIAAAAPGLGDAHIALSVGYRAAVDEALARLKGLGVKVVSEPRTTGDGYYEAVVEDPEGNKIELVTEPDM